MLSFEAVKAKSILNQYKRRDNWFWGRYSINPYKGCQHACNYCDAQTAKYLVHRNVEDFSRVIYVKSNAAELLGKKAVGTRRAARIPKDVVIMSGTTDPYQPAEEEFKITRNLLEVLSEHGFSVHIITKSDLVLRDIDLLSKIAKASWCTVSFTITTFDSELVSRLEPHAPSPEKRLEAVQRLVKAGIHVGVLFYPIIPFLEDSEENIRSVIGKAAESGAKYVVPAAGMTWRSNQKERFRTLLKENWPQLLRKYRLLYGGSEHPRREYVLRINALTSRVCRECAIPNYISPPDFEVPFRDNLCVANLLLLMAYFVFRGVPRPYKMGAYLRAAQNIELLSENIRQIYQKGDLRKIEGIGSSITQSITEFLDTGKCEKLEQMKREW